MCPTDFEPMYTACIPSALWEEFLTPSEAAVSFTHLYPTDPIYFPLTGEERSALLHALFPCKTLTLPEQTPPDRTQPATFHCQLICNPIYLCFNQKLKKNNNAWVNTDKKQWQFCYCSIWSNCSFCFFSIHWFHGFPSILLSCLCLKNIISFYACISIRSSHHASLLIFRFTFCIYINWCFPVPPTPPLCQQIPRTLPSYHLLSSAASLPQPVCSCTKSCTQFLLSLHRFPTLLIPSPIRHFKDY